MKVYIGEKQSGGGGYGMWKDNLVEKRFSGYFFFKKKN